MKNVLLLGDSFACPWSGDYKGWPDLLSEKVHLTNLAQAGVSEYKILNQLKSSDFRNFDVVIVSHTSPLRIHTKKHPIHKHGLHKDCDLIANDILPRFSLFNKSLQSAKLWFKYHNDEAFQYDIYYLLRKEIRTMLGSMKYISITHTELSKEHTIEHNNIDFSKVWQKHRGKVNHYTEQGNRIVYNELLDIINK